MTMTRSIVIGLAIVMISTSGALAAHRAYHHRTSYQASPGLNPYAMGPTNPNDHAMYLKNLRAAGYNPKNDYTANGLLKNQ
jgi:hypothetical protein